MTTEELYKIYQKHPVISTDTRRIRQDSLFFCLKGDNFNGNEFADEAIDKGAAYAIVDEEKYRKSEKHILVNNSLSALQELAIHHRKQLIIPVIGITGTNGKTTTKELINAVLSRKYRTVATAGNLNNHIGTPLSILNITHNTDIAIIEMGANHPGEIAELCEISKPDFGIITNIGIAHTEGFGSFENIIATKRALYESVQKRNGVVFVNGDDELLMKLSEGMKRVVYGKDNSFDCNGELAGKGLQVKVKWNSENEKNKSVEFIAQTQLIGSYNFENILAAICIGQYFNVSDELIKKALEEYQPTGYRSQYIDTGKNKLVMDAYNANPSSLALALKNFAELEMKEKVVIIGDMFELGKEADNEHEKIVKQLKKLKFERTILVGPIFSRNNDDFESFQNSEEACNYLKQNPIISKTILIKGSRGIKLEKIIEAL